jgi:hypothetical protein
MLWFPRFSEVRDTFSFWRNSHEHNQPNFKENLCAQKVMEATVDTYFAPNKTIRELRELIKSGAGIDPLKDFSEAAREELWAFILP